MSKVDPTQFSKLDRRSTILLQAARQRTEGVEEKSLSGVEEPGIDTLRGSFGAFGSIIRARSVRRASQSSRGSAPSNRFGASSSRLDLERGASKTSSSTAANISHHHYGALTRHQLFDPPVRHLDSLDADAVSLSSQSSARKAAIKFGEQDVIHSYHRGIAGKDDTPSPLELPSDTRLRQQQLDSANSSSPPRLDAGVNSPSSAPPGVGMSVEAYHDPFEGAPATTTLPSFPSASFVDDSEPRRQHHRGFSRQGSSRDYPKGHRADDAEETVSLWDPHGDNTSDMDASLSPDSTHGTVRLVGSRSGRF
jgi:hypothetical protein